MDYESFALCKYPKAGKCPNSAFRNGYHRVGMVPILSLLDDWMSKSMFDLPDGIEGLIPVMCCWNDDNGNFSEKLVKLDLHDAIEIETQFVSEDFDLDGVACKLDGGVLTICGEQFPFQHHRTWVGNIMWDLIWMTPEDVLRMMNCLQVSRHFGVDSGLTELLDKWDRREPFNQADLALIVEGAEGFAL